MFASGCGALAMVLWPSTALAQYLDPGAGSIIVQVVIAVLVGVGATVKVYWRTISAFLSRRSKRDVSI
ncbi:MAG: hypothetical protein ABI742_01655 [Gemmatimonadota bacterium]